MFSLSVFPLTKNVKCFMKGKKASSCKAKSHGNWNEGLGMKAALNLLGKESKEKKYSIKHWIRNGMRRRQLRGEKPVRKYLTSTI